MRHFSKSLVEFHQNVEDKRVIMFDTIRDMVTPKQAKAAAKRRHTGTPALNPWAKASSATKRLQQVDDDLPFVGMGYKMKYELLSELQSCTRHDGTVDDRALARIQTSYELTDDQVKELRRWWTRSATLLDPPLPSLERSIPMTRPRTSTNLTSKLAHLESALRNMRTDVPPSERLLDTWRRAT